MQDSVRSSRSGSEECQNEAGTDLSPRPEPFRAKFRTGTPSLHKDPVVPRNATSASADSASEAKQSAPVTGLRPIKRNAPALFRGKKGETRGDGSIHDEQEPSVGAAAASATSAPFRLRDRSSHTQADQEAPVSDQSVPHFTDDEFDDWADWSDERGNDEPTGRFQARGRLRDRVVRLAEHKQPTQKPALHPSQPPSYRARATGQSESVHPAPRPYRQPKNSFEDDEGYQEDDAMPTPSRAGARPAPRHTRARSALPSTRQASSARQPYSPNQGRSFQRAPAREYPSEHDYAPRQSPKRQAPERWSREGWHPRLDPRFDDDTRGNRDPLYSPRRQPTSFRGERYSPQDADYAPRSRTSRNSADLIDTTAERLGTAYSDHLQPSIRAPRRPDMNRGGDSLRGRRGSRTPSRGTRQSDGWWE